MKRTVFFVLFIIVSRFSFSQNVVLNPGFEAWEKSSKPAGWTTAQNCLKDSIYIHSGKYSCRQDGGTKYLGQTITVVAGKHYLFSFYYKTVITAPGNGCRIWCYWKDSNGNNLTDLLTDDILRPSKYLKSDTWLQFSADFSAPAGSASFYLEVRTYSNSISYFDDFVFEESATTGVSEETEPDLKIYPNPASGYLRISGIYNIKRIEIQNLSGVTLVSYPYSGDNEVILDISELIAGSYVVKIQTRNRLITRMFIKNTSYN